jgi:hypothetical protein
VSDSRSSRRLLVCVGAAVAAFGLGVSTFLAWTTTPIATGGRAAISGWGEVSGGSTLDGMNLNSVVGMLGGHGSYHPAIPVMVAAVIVLVCALVLSATRSTRRIGRPVAAVMGAAGLATGAWASVRIIRPADAMGVLRAGQYAAGAGPVVALVAGLVAAVIATVVLCGLVDPATPRPRRGIAP